MPDPYSAASVMAPLGLWWGIAGGWALDLWLGETTRDHHDVEVVVRRADQARVHEALRGEWELFCLDPPGSAWRRWTAGERLLAPSFQAKAYQQGHEFDVFFEDVVDHVWTFRRDQSIQRPVDRVLALTRSGVPVVRPEVQLLYMSKSDDAKHEQDFEAALPRLGIDEVAWLRDALEVVAPEHRWISLLRAR
jgi:hypothetical protein